MHTHLGHIQHLAESSQGWLPLLKATGIQGGWP
jgi:hypothetical protein